MCQDQPRELPKLSDVRWACRFYACRNLMDQLPAVLRVLHDIDEEKVPTGSPRLALLFMELLSQSQLVS